jgi:phospholipid/cholesterol/gamma-HCH transport system substrate-binding protein
LQIKTETIVGLFILVALGIFFYMTFFLGIFKLDRLQYRSYTVYFKDISGLEKKAEVKIAGVKVGWVEGIALVHDDPYQAKAHILVHKRYILRSDAYAIVRQNGLLGAKYLELLPGDPLLPPLSSGQALGEPGKPPASIDEILHKVQGIAQNVQDVTESLQESFGGYQGKEQIKTMFDNLQDAVQRFANFSSVIDRTLSYNEDSINTMITDLKDVAQNMRETFPSIKDGVERISNRLDKDIGALSEKLESSVGAFEEAAIQARDGLKNLGSITEKIDEGKGTIGKLINEEETYRDLKVTIQGLKNYFSKVDALSIVFDSHGEYMYRPAENVNFEDAKGYLDIRIHPNDDYFYLLQAVGTQKGTITRSIKEVRWYDEECVEFLPRELVDRGVAIPELVGKVEKRKRKLDQFKIGAQVGKIYKDLAFRIGIFENTAGMAVDFDIPFGTDKFRWVTSLEAFDFRGRDRFDDSRPHIKWINRVFLLRNIYMAFGADDFISKRNANGFFGCGLRFCDDDIKYFLSSLGLSGLSGQ